ncbi:MAG: LamG-like jellyroll fold domain-containing protein [Luteolibacter sp.]
MKILSAISAINFGFILSTNAATLAHSWSFSETTTPAAGATVADSVGSNNGTVGAGGSPDLNVAGPNVTFNGGSAYDTGAANNSGIAAGTDPAFIGNPAFAISAWFNADALTANDRIFELGSSTGDRQRFIVTAEGTGLGIRYQGGNFFYGTLITNTWYHVVAQYDGTAIGAGGAGIQVFINGVLTAENGSGAGGALGALDIQAGNIYIGRDLGAAAGGAFDGTLDEVKLFSGNLTQGEVTSLYTTNAIPEPSTFALLGLGMAGLLIRRRR